MKNSFYKLKVLIAVVLSLSTVKLSAQAGVGPAPYCFPLYSTLPCNQPGPSNAGGNFINDFINGFNTTGATNNITNNNSGCNAQTFAGVGIRNYFYFGCTHYLIVNPGQVITCNYQSGNTYSQGFTVFVDWNQDGVFQLTERVTSAPGVPPAASWSTSNFTIPGAQAPGIYRMRVRCAYATTGNTIDPCINYGFGETEDYNLYVAPSAPAGIITATASSNSPLCSGNPINLTVNSSATVPVTYTWGGPGGYSSTLQNPTIANATATMSGVYSVTVSTGSCPVTKTVNVQVTNYPTYTLTPLTATVCQGGVFTPSVVLGTLAGNPCSTVGIGPVCASPASVVVGNGTTPNSSWQAPSPYNKYYYDHHQQIIYRASELQAAGVQAGYLNSIAFNVAATNGVNNMTNFTIKIKCTTASVVTSFDNTGLNQVFQAASFTPVNGWNTHNFTTPYYWDGTSNILIDLCRGNSPWQFVNSSVFMTNVGYQVTMWDGAFGPGQNTCGGNGNMGSSTDRPNTRWSNCPSVLPQWYNYLWTQGPGIAAPTATSTQITTQPITGTVATVVYSVVVTPTVYACPTLQTLTVTVVNPMSPTITPVNPLCNTFAALNMTATPGGGVWSTNTGISAGGLLTPSLAPIGTSTVMYSVGIGSCIATQTAAIEVSTFNSAALSGSISPLCVTTAPVNLYGIVTNTTGIWTGTGVTGTYSFNPAGLATNIYTLNYNTASAPNATVCPDASSIQVSLLNPPTPTITAVGPYCNTAGNVQMVVNPSTGTWTPVSYQSAGGVFSPSLAAIGSNTVQYVIGTFTCNTEHTSTINIEQFVPATITGSITDQCNINSQINLNPLTANNLGTWSGPGVIGTVFDPSTSGTGVLTLTYSTNSAPVGLCPDQATLSVSVFSLAAPSITQIGPFCNSNANVQIPVSPTGGIFGGANTNAVTVGGIFSPAQANIGNNLINYTVTSGPCIAYAQTTISIEKFISADFSSYAGPYCRNDAPVNLNSIVQNPGGTWNGPGLNGSLFSPANANIGNNNVVTYFTNSLPTASLCPDSSAIRIQVNEIPSVEVVSNLEKGCLPLEVLFNTPSTNSGTGQWNFGDGSPVMNGLNLTHMYTSPGSYTVTFTYQDEIGCRTQTTLPFPIQAFPMPHAAFSFSPDEITIANAEVQFSNLSTILGGNTYQWQIHNLYQLNEVNPKVIFPVAGDYKITLTATTPEGCKDEVSQLITVKNDYGVYIPSSFTPNFDGVNDIFSPVFSPYGLDLKVYEMEIFDRWGESLFQTKDPLVGWNGFAKGTDEPVKQDVYVYKVKYKDIEGKIHHKTGHVTILK